MTIKNGISVAALGAVLGLGFAAAAGAQTIQTTLTGTLTADNQFSVYLSSSANTLGTLVASGGEWQTTFTFTTPLTARVEYLQVIATNWTTDNGLWSTAGTRNGSGSNPDGFIGAFSINIGGTSYKFANNTTSLLTDTTDWQADPAPIPQTTQWPITALPAWSAPTGTPQAYAYNGGGVWGPDLGGAEPGIPSNAQWIWSNPDNLDYAEFSTTITDSPAAPEVSTWTMPVSGFGALGFAALRRSKRAPASILG